MSGIGKHNYLDKFIGFHEGLLNPEQVHELEVFLLENPEYRDEFEALGDVYLKSPEFSSFPDKGSLKKCDAEKTGVEEEVLRLIPVIQRMPSATDLKIGEEDELPPFLIVKLEELNLSYSLKPDLSIRFENPSGLKKKEGRIIAFYPTIKQFIAVAASLLLIWMLWPSQAPTGKSLQSAVNESNRILKLADAIDGSEPLELVSVSATSDSGQNQSPEQIEKAIERKELTFSKLPRLGVPTIRMADFRNDKIPAMRPLPVVSQVPQPNYAQLPVQNREMPKYISLGEYARIRLNQSLVNEADPKEGLLVALLDKSVDKLADKTDIDMDLEVQKEKGKRMEHFRFTIGRLEIVK